MFGAWFAVTALSLAGAGAILAAASVREQPRPEVGVHGLQWVVVHGLWRPPGTPGLGWWLFRLALLYGVGYPPLVLAAGVRVLPDWVPVGWSLAFLAAAASVATAAVGSAPWWSSELVAGAEGLRVTGRWPRSPVTVRWSAVQEIRVTGRDLVIEGPTSRVVLGMAWGPKSLLTEVAAALDATRSTAATTAPEPAPPPELAALRASVREGN